MADMEQIRLVEGRRGMRVLMGRAVGLDHTALARVREYGEGALEVFVTTPFEVVASRRAQGQCSRDGAVFPARTLLDAIDSDAAEVGPPQDPWWPGALPPVTGFRLKEELPAQVVRRLSDEGRRLARQFSGPLGPPSSLLNQSVLTIEGDEPLDIPMRVIFTITALGLLPRSDIATTVPQQLRISQAGRWLRVDAPFGTVYHAAQSGMLINMPATRSQ